ncbi:hypothetical protein ACTA71_005378 [Dictyostelium dimigraforme]
MLKFFFFYLFLFFSTFTNSQTLIKEEYDCLEKLLTSLGTLYKVKQNSTTLEYYFCGSMDYNAPIIGIFCDGGSVFRLELQSTNTSLVFRDELLCFQNLVDASLSSVVYDKDILFTSLPQKLYRFQLSGDNILLSLLPSKIKFFIVSMNTQTISNVIKFSWLTNLEQIFVRAELDIGGKNLITFENDLDGTKIWGPTVFSIASLNIPNLQYINSYIQLRLLYGFDQLSWGNITSWSNMVGAEIISDFPSFFPSTAISQLRSNNLKKLSFKIPFSGLQGFIDLSLLGNSIETLSFTGTSRDFTMGGTFPIILPTNQAFSTFILKDAYIETFDMSPFSNVISLSLLNNTMSGSLASIFDSETYGKLLFLDLSNNQMTGTIDDSFCSLDIIVTGNNMEGLIPSCFTCFFGLSNINLESRFTGNNFINLNQPSSPSIIIPNIVRGDFPSENGVYELFLFGENIGGNWVEKGIVTTLDGVEFYIDVLKPNKLIRLFLYFSAPTNIVYLNYSPSNSNYMFTLSWDNTPPQLKNVDWQSSTTDLVFDGSFFTYNISIINITIGNENCLASTTTFYQIKCTLSNVIDSSLQDIISFITIGNLTTQFTLNPGLINTILNCTNNCNYNGYCLSDIGQCKCNSNYQGSDCSMPYIECLPIDCNGNGICINTTGKCQCDSGHQGNACELPFVECLNDCNGNGICTNTTGQCRCNSNYQGSDCGIPYIECNPIDCNGNGVCTNSTGKCQCDSNYQGNACELPFVECLNDCNNNIGKCNNQTGICICPINPHGWSGVDCSIPLHTISGAAPSNTNGGIASIYGWFGNIHTGKQVFIGNQECTPIYNFTETEIICNSPAGTGLKSISVIQNSINVTSKDIYQYYSNDKQCPNHCTSTLNGICNSTTGYCNCIGRWSGYDCSLYSNPSTGGGSDGNGNNGLPVSNTTIDGNTGGTNINNQQTNYQILITKLIEIDFNGNQINEYSLLNKWTIFSNISKTVYTFIQSIQNDQCNITYTIEEINNDRDISFAGVSFKLTSGSVKMTVSIENYQYSSNLNTLQLQMESSVNEIQTNDKNDCNNDQIEINSTTNQDNSLNYIAIKKDSKVLNGRFIDRIESDGKSTFMQTVLISKSNDSITVGMNLPHCTKKCFLDPDFSVLISPEFIDECDDDKRESWFLPVVIAVPVGGTAAIAAIGYVIYKKRFVETPLKRKLQRLSTSVAN